MVRLTAAGARAHAFLAPASGNRGDELVVGAHDGKKLRILDVKAWPCTSRAPARALALDVIGQGMDFQEVVDTPHFHQRLLRETTNLERQAAGQERYYRANDPRRSAGLALRY